MRFEADCLGSARREHVISGVGRRRSAARLRSARVGPTRPNQLGSNKALYVERRKAVGNLFGRLPLIADELEHVTISVFHEPTILVVADGIGLGCSRTHELGARR
jgi:hypothetical protein